MVWASAHLTGRPWHSQTAFAVSASGLQDYSEGEDAEEVREALEKAVQWTPMKWQAYFQPRPIQTQWIEKSAAGDRGFSAVAVS